ncbi:hypothetical protein WA158_003976 [Blastocystis sp. Blastoise]
MFCFNCITRWLKDKNSCPLCRQTPNQIISNIESPYIYKQNLFPFHDNYKQILPKNHEIDSYLSPWIQRECEIIIKYDIDIVLSYIKRSLYLYGSNNILFFDSLFIFFKEYTFKFVLEMENYYGSNKKTKEDYDRQTIYLSPWCSEDFSNIFKETNESKIYSSLKSSKDHFEYYLTFYRHLRNEYIEEEQRCWKEERIKNLKSFISNIDAKIHETSERLQQNEKQIMDSEYIEGTLHNTFHQLYFLLEQNAQEEYSRVHHRFYEEKFPKVDSVVMAKVIKIEDIGVYVSLLEYNGIEGFVPTSELSRRRIRSIPKLIRIGRIEAFCVIRVDEDKGYVDLSKRKVPPEDIEAADEKYQMGKKVQNIIGHVSVELGCDIDDLYTKIVWPLSKIYEHCYKAFLVAVNDPESVFKYVTIDEDIKEALLHDIREKMASQPKKIRADIEVSCCTSIGIDGIKDAMYQGIALGTEKNPIHISLIAPPLYVVTTTHTSEKEGVQLLEDAIQAIDTRIKEHGGKLVVKSSPRVTQKNEDVELDGLLKRIELENREVDGDSDDEDED